MSNPVDKTPFVAAARKAIELIAAEYVTEQRAKGITEFPQEMMDELTVQCQHFVFRIMFIMIVSANGMIDLTNPSPGDLKKLEALMHWGTVKNTDMQAWFRAKFLPSVRHLQKMIKDNELE